MNDAIRTVELLHPPIMAPSAAPNNPQFCALITCNDHRLLQLHSRHRSALLGISLAVVARVSQRPGGGGIQIFMIEDHGTAAENHIIFQNEPPPHYAPSTPPHPLILSPAITTALIDSCKVTTDRAVVVFSTDHCRLVVTTVLRRVSFYSRISHHQP